ncbi:hypothetical protein K7711_26480 [Nocardia sp. CA2R105]|uniref:hypothetical protein n=1 Tax=Nocardia coffeae TaxID=2873381 RepID=UPI001CA61915|nr:hypothetical protein [Nocardia coffeae]MBY8860045.1 hypothetical protein [Nocardia coffeae]
MGDVIRARRTRSSTRVRCVLAVLLSIALTWAGPPASAASPDGAITVDPSQQLHRKVTLDELPVPPTAPSTAAGSCTAAINPHGTGCVSPAWGALGAAGTYWPSSRYVLVGAVLTGAPTAGPATIYTGPQVLLVHTDGATFPNGDGWKCLTCGVASPAAFSENANFTYPINGFHDGHRALAGASVIDCGAHEFADPRCTSTQLHAYPLYWDDGTGKPGALREPRLNPDDTHIGFNYAVTTGGAYDEFAFMGTLNFDRANGRYDIDKVRMLLNPAPSFQPYAVADGQLRFQPAGMIGEFRGWTANGTAALGIQSAESDGIDAWATDNTTGRSRLLTRHAQYTDPMAPSPDGRYLLSEQVLGSGRLDFISGMQGIAPLTDQAGTTGHISGIRNNGQRRFFLPYVVDLGSGRSQQLDPGGDPGWNAAADPAWLADSTAAVWAENLVTAPACGAGNALPCPISREPGGRHSRVMIARFTDTAPTAPIAVPPAPEATWGIAYHPGDPMPTRPHLPAGTYTLPGKRSGAAKVVVTEDATAARVMRIQVSYKDFSDTPDSTLNGTESVQRVSDAAISAYTWHEDLLMSGRHQGTKKTSEPDGFTLSPAVLQNDFQATGTMTTTSDGRVYTQPANGT